MGVVAIDINASERQLETMFPMHTKEGVEVFLENINQIYELTFYSGDYDALIMLIDFFDAFEDCGLTSREANVITLVFLEDQKRVDVAKALGITKQTVQTLLNRGLEKIASYYKRSVEND